MEMEELKAPKTPMTVEISTEKKAAEEDKTLGKTFFECVPSIFCKERILRLPAAGR